MPNRSSSVRASDQETTKVVHYAEENLRFDSSSKILKIQDTKSSRINCVRIRLANFIIDNLITVSIVEFYYICILYR